ncbi:MAG: hypothetical protein ABIV06_10580 [Thermoanaerobaculia bacterium]
MRIEDEATLKRALDPERVEVERVVAAALAARPTDVKRGARWAAVAVALIALVVTYARREPPFTEPLQFSGGGEVTTSVSNFGSVMLVEGGSGRTLVAGGAVKRESIGQQHSYRITITKGAAP